MYLEELQQPASLNETLSFIIHLATAGIRCGPRAASISTFPSGIPDQHFVFCIHFLPLLQPHSSSQQTAETDTLTTHTYPETTIHNKFTIYISFSTDFQDEKVNGNL